MAWSTGWLASHSGVNRVSRICTMVAARSSAGTASSSWRAYDAPPSPPGDVQSSASRSIRSGQVTASSWATMPPKLTPMTALVAQPRWSRSAAASAA